jgi:hypothetical protein
MFLGQSRGSRGLPWYVDAGADLTADGIGGPGAPQQRGPPCISSSSGLGIPRSVRARHAAADSGGDGTEGFRAGHPLILERPRFSGAGERECARRDGGFSSSAPSTPTTVRPTLVFGRPEIPGSLSAGPRPTPLRGGARSAREAVVHQGRRVRVNPVQACRVVSGYGLTSTADWHRLTSCSALPLPTRATGEGGAGEQLRSCSDARTIPGWFHFFFAIWRTRFPTQRLGGRLRHGLRAEGSLRAMTSPAHPWL